MCKQKQSRSTDRNAGLMPTHPHPRTHNTHTHGGLWRHIPWGRLLNRVLLFLMIPTHLGQFNGCWAFIKHLCKRGTVYPFPKAHVKLPVPFLPGVRYPASQFHFASDWPCALGSISTSLGFGSLIWRCRLITMIHTLFQNALKVVSGKWGHLEEIIFKKITSFHMLYFYDFERYWHLKTDLKMVWGIGVWVILSRYSNNFSSCLIKTQSGWSPDF